MNLFFMSVISFLFIHATIFIFPVVSDKLYVDILKKKLIKSVKKGIINKHASILPNSRGLLPFFWNIYFFFFNPFNKVFLFIIF